MKQSGFWWSKQQPWITILSIFSAALISYVGCVGMKTDVGLQSELTDAIRVGSTEDVVSVLNRGASPKMRDASGLSPLEAAVLWNQPDLVLLLINSGANVNSSDEFGFTPLMHAARANNLEVVRVLLNSGADPFLITPSTGNTAFHFASATSHEAVLQELLRHTKHLQPETVEVDQPGSD